MIKELGILAAAASMVAACTTGEQTIVNSKASTLDSKCLPQAQRVIGDVAFDQGQALVWVQQEKGKLDFP